MVSIVPEARREVLKVFSNAICSEIAFFLLYLASRGYLASNINELQRSLKNGLIH